MARAGLVASRLPPGIVLCHCGVSLTDPYAIQDNRPARLSQTWAFNCGQCGRTEQMEISYQLLGSLPGYPALPYFTHSAQPAGLLLPLSPPEPDPEPDPPAEPPPVIQGSVLGYRAWRIKDWQLIGSYSTVPWVPGVNAAICSPPAGNPYAPFPTYGHGHHPAPAPGCSCGITALARFAEADEHWGEDCDIRGAIEAWSDETMTAAKPGDVADAVGFHSPRKSGGVQPNHEGGRFFLHPTGFRAQYAKIVLLAVDDNWPVAKKAAVRALANEHGADTCRRDHLEDAAKEHGQLVSDEMLKWAGELDPPTVEFTATFHTASLSKAMAHFAQQMQGLGVNLARAQLGLQSLSASTPPAKPRRRKGVKLTLKTAGPPPLGKHTKGDLARDKKGAIWACQRSGTPGTWTLYEEE
jgi:hypothetical protein